MQFIMAIINGTIEILKCEYSISHAKVHASICLMDKYSHKISKIENTLDKKNDSDGLNHGRITLLCVH